MTQRSGSCPGRLDSLSVYSHDTCTLPFYLDQWHECTMVHGHLGVLITCVGGRHLVDTSLQVNIYVHLQLQGIIPDLKATPAKVYADIQATP